jgi:hypothetical protein
LRIWKWGDQLRSAPHLKRFEKHLGVHVGKIAKPSSAAPTVLIIASGALTAAVARRDLSGQALVFGGQWGGSCDARRRPDDGRCFRRNGFSDSRSGGHAGARIGAEAAAILIYTHGDRADHDNSACSDRGNRPGSLVAHVISFPSIFEYQPHWVEGYSALYERFPGNPDKGDR